jgi:hypothetical protein
MNWSRRRTLVAGLSLIVVTNVVVLAGAAFNRGGEPDAQLRLTEREMRIPYSWGFRSENSGLALRLNWRLAQPDTDMHDYGQGGWGGPTTWLDQAKLAELGFDLSAPADRLVAERHYDRQAEREVFIVLEHDGPAYQAALKRAEARNHGPNAGQGTWNQLQGELNTYSRLFAIDAGLGRETLRAKYPDRSRYAIAPGKVRIGLWHARPGERVIGYISDLSVAEINVPLELRDTVGTTPFEGVSARDPGETRLGYEATVAFGRRLEPWLVSAARRKRP